MNHTSNLYNIINVVSNFDVFPLYATGNTISWTKSWGSNCFKLLVNGPVMMKLISFYLFKMLRCLKKNNVNLDTINFLGETPLISKIKEGDFSCSLMLLVEAADASASDLLGNSCLHLAIEVSFLKFLIL